jgi:hypothetical protein
MARNARVYDNGAVTLWTNDTVPPAKHLDFGNDGSPG